MVNVLIADDNVNVRKAIRLALERKVLARVVGETGRGEDVLDQVTLLRPGMLLLDWELPGTPVEHLLPALRRSFPALWIIAMSSRSEARPFALRSGADAFVCKSAPVDELLLAVTKAPPGS